LILLKENKIPLGIVTGKGRESADISLEKLGLTTYFDVVEAGDDEGGVKPEAIRRVVRDWNLPGEKVIYVGDLTYDIRSARAAGVIPLAVTWSNTMTQEELESEKPEAIFSTIDDFIGWLITEGGLTREG
jgi:phosphoglycolate phosphatase/pyrophosphatase PpaX